jgi:hypothetical protein
MSADSAAEARICEGRRAISSELRELGSRRLRSEDLVILSGHISRLTIGDSVWPIT